MANIQFSPYFTDDEEKNRIQLQIQDVVNKINSVLNEVEDTQFIVVPSTSSASSGGSFTPSQENLYESVKSIIQAGSNVTVTADDSGFTLTVAATAGQGGGLSEAQVDARVRALVADQAEQGDTGQWPATKIANLDASKIASGTMDDSRLPSGLARDSEVEGFAKVSDTTSTVPDGKIPVGITRDSEVESYAKVGDSTLVPPNRLPFKIVSITQTAYDALDTKDATTLYVIPEA